MATKKCQRHACNQEYTEESNTDACCQHHPGVPVFHDALKGWSCCDKRVLNFDQFLEIKGCTWSRHTEEKPDVGEKVTGTHTEIPIGPTPAKPIVRAPPPSASAKEVKIDPLEIPDPEDAAIAVGTACLHRGCHYTYVDEASRTAPCCYHRGTPVFHDASKGWSCCRKKVMELEQIFNIEGCSDGVHKFVKPPKDPNEKIELRNDWYQNPSKVTLSIFAKKTDKEKCTVQFGEQTADVHIVFKDGTIYDRVFNFLFPINAENCKYEVLSTKVEIAVVKKDGGDWERLEL